MGLLFWKKNAEIDAFAKTLSDDLFSRIQPVAMQLYFGFAVDGQKPLTPQKTKEVQQRLQDMLMQVRQFKQLNKLGIYGKARLHMIFRERLTELGFAPEVVQKLDRLVLLQTP